MEKRWKNFVLFWITPEIVFSGKSKWTISKGCFSSRLTFLQIWHAVCVVLQSTESLLWKLQTSFNRFFSLLNCGPEGRLVILGCLKWALMISRPRKTFVLQLLIGRGVFIFWVWDQIFHHLWEWFHQMACFQNLKGLKSNKNWWQGEMERGYKWQIVR